MTRALIILALLVPATFPAWAQVGDTAAVHVVEAVDGAADAETEAYIRIESNVEDALVFADSIYVGRISSDLLAVPAEAERIRLIAGDLDSWSIAPISGPLNAEPGDTLELRLDFDYHYRIESMPFGAAVHLERAGERIHLGSTPVLYRSERPLEGSLSIERAGYAVERLQPGVDVWNQHVVTLSPSNDLDVQVASVNWKPPRHHRRWIDYAALGTAVTAGAIAVHYKFKADKLYSEYEDTADQSLRPEIHAYDVRSGIAFGVMQAGISVFAVRLFLR